MPRRPRCMARACCGLSMTCTSRPGRARWSTRSRSCGTVAAVAGAHRSPMDPPRSERTGLYRPELVKRPPRCLPDEQFNELFARLGSHRDRALVAFWVSTGARASELLGATCGDLDAGSQLVTVVRKGTRAMQPLPASPDAFVWLRLYQAEFRGLVPEGRDDPLWWTLRRPFRQLNYHAARAMFNRAGALLGANWSLHDLRHTAAYRMARDKDMPLTDVILSFRVSQCCDLRRPVVDSVADGTPAA